MDGVVSFITAGALGPGTAGDNALCASHTIDSITFDGSETGEQKEVEIYSNGVDVKANEEVTTTVFDNYLQDSQQAAWMKVQIAVAEAYQNGSTKSQAKIAAKDAIAEYYAVKQVNLIKSWNSTSKSTVILAKQAKNQSGVTNDFVGTDTYENQFRLYYESESTATVTLTNGSTRQVQKTTWGDGSYSTSKSMTSSGNSFPIKIQAPNSDYDMLYLLDATKYTQKWTTIQNQKSSLSNEAETFVNATWSDYDSGAINASDVISANTAMFEYGTAYNESGSLYDSVGALAIMGFDTPDLNNSGTMTISYNGQNHTGILMARNAPNGSWAVNTTYNASNISGPVFMATTGGAKVDIAEGDTFTVTGMTSTDGEQMQSVNTTQYVYRTANTSQLNEMQDRLALLQAELEERQQSAGGSSGVGGMSPEAIGIILLAVAGIGAMSRRDQNRGGRGGSW